MIPGEESGMLLAETPAAVDWVRDAFNHCKVIAVTNAAGPLLDAARVEAGEGIIDLGRKGVSQFIEIAKRGRIWSREERAPKP